MPAPTITPEIEARFWSKVDRTSEGCWVWNPTKPKPLGRYGQFQIGRRPWGAHRISYLLTHGELPDDKLVLHSCDNPPCVRPDHLRLGSTGDNAQDVVARGRMPKPDYLLSVNSAALELGLSPATIRQQIRRGKLRRDPMILAIHIRRSEVERYRAQSRGKVGRPPK